MCLRRQQRSNEACRLEVAEHDIYIACLLPFREHTQRTLPFAFARARVQTSSTTVLECCRSCVKERASRLRRATYEMRYNLRFVVLMYTSSYRCRLSATDGSIWRLTFRLRLPLSCSTCTYYITSADHNHDVNICSIIGVRERESPRRFRQAVHH